MKIRRSLRKFGAGGSVARAATRAAEPFDPDAIDGDNDGLVQEGTAFERVATPKVPASVTPEKGPKIVPRKGPYSDRPILARGKRNINPSSQIADEAVGDPRIEAIEKVLGKRTPMHRRMTKEEIAKEKARLVGLKVSSIYKKDKKAKPRYDFAPGWKSEQFFEGVDFRDSILNTFSARVREIVDARSDLNYKELEEKYGKLDTVEDLVAALQKAYPNTGAGSISITYPLMQQMFNGRLDTPMKTEMLYDEIDPSMAMVRYEMLKMLQWGNENPRTSSQISNLIIGDPFQRTALGSMGRNAITGIGRSQGVNDAGVMQHGYEWLGNDQMHNANPESMGLAYSVTMNLARIMSWYNSEDRTKKPDALGIERAWNTSELHGSFDEPKSIDNLLNVLQATHDHEFGHVTWFNAISRGIGGNADNVGYIGESAMSSSRAIAIAQKQFADLGIDDPNELIRQLVVNAAREISQSISNAKNNGRLPQFQIWNTGVWNDSAQRLEDATDPDEIRNLTINLLDQFRDYNINPGAFLFGSVMGRGLYSNPKKNRPGYIPKNTLAIQISDNPYNMPAFMLYRVFEKAGIDISLAETKQLLKDAMKFMSDRSQYGSVSVSEAFAELYSYKALGYLKESDGAPWRFLQLFDQAFEAMGGKSLSLMLSIDTKSLRKIQNFRKARKARRIVEPFDANAIDADGDGIVQDGTIHERPNIAGGANLIADQVRMNRPVKKKKKKPNKPAASPANQGKPLTGQVDNPETNLIDKTRLKRRRRDLTTAVEFSDDLTTEEKTKIIDKIKSMTIGRGDHSTTSWRGPSRTKPTEVTGIIKPDELDGSPFSTFSSRVIKAHREKSTVDVDRIEKEFGEIKTMQDLHDALSKALPNMQEFEFRFTFHEGQFDDLLEESATGEAIRNDVIDEIDTHMLATYSQAMRLLEWSLENPESAKNIEILHFGNLEESESVGFFGRKKLNLKQQAMIRDVRMINARTAKEQIGAKLIHKIKGRVQPKDKDKTSAEVLIRRAEMLVDHESFHVTHDTLVYRLFGEYPLDILGGMVPLSEVDAAKMKSGYIQILTDAGIDDPVSVYHFTLASSALDIASTMSRRPGDLPQSVRRDAKRVSDEINDIASRLLASNSVTEQNQLANQLEKVLVDNNIFLPHALVGPLRGDMPFSYRVVDPRTQKIGVAPIGGPGVTQEQKMSGRIFAIPIKKMLENTDIDPERIDAIVAAAASWMARSETSYGTTMWAELISELFTAYKGGMLTERDGDAYLLVQYILQALESTGGKSLGSFLSGLTIKVETNA